jgi:hypothetical protein
MIQIHHHHIQNLINLILLSNSIQVIYLLQISFISFGIPLILHLPIPSSHSHSPSSLVVFPHFSGGIEHCVAFSCWKYAHGVQQVNSSGAVPDLQWQKKVLWLIYDVFNSYLICWRDQQRLLLLEHYFFFWLWMHQLNKTAKYKRSTPALSVVHLTDEIDVTGGVKKYLQPYIDRKIFFRAFKWCSYLVRLSCLSWVIVCWMQRIGSTDLFVFVENWYVSTVLQLSYFVRANILFLIYSKSVFWNPLSGRLGIMIPLGCIVLLLYIAVLNVQTLCSLFETRVHHKSFCICLWTLPLDHQWAAAMSSRQGRFWHLWLACLTYLNDGNKLQ